MHSEKQASSENGGLQAGHIIESPKNASARADNSVDGSLTESAAIENAELRRDGSAEPDSAKGKRGRGEKLNTELGPVRQDEVYPLEVFSRLTGLREWALRKLRKNGMRIKRIGSRSYVDGQEFIAYVRRTTPDAPLTE